MTSIPLLNVDASAAIAPLKPESTLRCNDKYVIVYDFSDIDYDDATKEFSELLQDLEEAGLHTEVRPGYDRSILVFVKAPRQLLGNSVYKERVKDWLYSVTQVHPGGDKDSVVTGRFEAEELLTMYHLVQWPKERGGAGVYPGLGKWTNVKACFPIHNEAVNKALLRHLSGRLLLTTEDLDRIRDLFGSKVAFYFAFIQNYLTFLTFPAATGVIAWLWFPKYSLAYAVMTSVWCTVFLEYWKLQEVDLSIRWDVRGIHKTKVNRPEFKYDKIIVDANGQEIHYFPKWKQITRQLLQIPFIAVATLALGAIICAVFGVEVLISETYTGPYQFYLEYLPTIILAVAIPYINSSLEGVAEALTAFENHRTADAHEVSYTQKLFILSIITNYLPILLTAFVYIPFGREIIPHLKSAVLAVLPGLEHTFATHSFEADADKLRNEVIALTLTGQLSSFFEENILPYLKHKATQWYRVYRRAYPKHAMLLTMVEDDEEETEFLARCRNQSSLDTYNVHDDMAELVLQFGYLALFSPVWPLIPLGFLINNWIELRSDFAKICIEHQRPNPVRADGVGPWNMSLDILTWIGSISTGAIVHIFGGADGIVINKNWATLPVTIFVSEHILLLLRAVTRGVFEKLGSEQIRRERAERYARRLAHLDEIEANKRAGLHLSVAERERRKSVLVTGDEKFWTKQVEDGASADMGIKLMSLARDWEQRRGLKKVKTS
ncbi:plasma membrane channel protein [Cordyceps javanica]|uniref:Plasma membrane channel protein n=1 Tax=Cordyceps javanica TaxID=43265 RepID=A0A545VKL6_9HYPO|nr:plasma membrane channel protein [Cordyceps javanica]TQW02245.1 plasma membrane channel protein [Cordyceps javanica]